MSNNSRSMENIICYATSIEPLDMGVAWDPKGQFLATLSSDRVCRVFDSTGKHVKARAHKGLLPVAEHHSLFNKEVKYFHDDTFKSYFRRLSFTPDGNLLITPSGHIEAEGYKSNNYTTLIFTLCSLTVPAVMLPSPKQETIAIRCCPILFELHPSGAAPVISLPYRMVIAVASSSDVVLYDTQQLSPFAHLQKIHYTRITDLSWSSDGLLLIASSTDGYCTFVTFEPEELGVQYVKEDSETEENPLNVSGCEELAKTEPTTTKVKEVESIKKPNLLEKWAIRKPKSDILKEDNIEILTDIKENKTPTPKGSNDSRVKKRIAPIKIGEVQKTNDKSAVSTIGSNKEEKQNAEEVACTNNDIVSHKENKLELSSNNRDCTTKLPSSAKKQDRDSPSSKKRKIEKTNTPDKNSNPLLKFLQVAKSNEKKVGNKTKSKIKNTQKQIKTSEIIEISEEENSDKDFAAEEEIENEKIIAPTNVIEVYDSDSQETPQNKTLQCMKTNNVVSVVKNTILTEKEDLKLDNKTKETTGSKHQQDNEIVDPVVEVPEIVADNIATFSKNSEKANLIEISSSKTIPMPKTPRRIALVTLSSPKRRKQL